MRKALPSPAAFVALPLVVMWVLPVPAAGPTVTASSTASTVGAAHLKVRRASPDLKVGGSIGWRAIPDADLTRQSEFDRAVQDHERRAAEKPNDPESWHRLAEIYAEKAQKDATLPRDLARQYVMRGLEMNERALTINPVYYEALGLKSILLRQRAAYEGDPSVRKKLVAEADAASAKAAELLKRQRGSGRGGN